MKSFVKVGDTVAVKPDAKKIKPSLRGLIGEVTGCVGEVFPFAFMVRFPDGFEGLFNGDELGVIAESIFANPIFLAINCRG